MKNTKLLRNLILFTLVIAMIFSALAMAIIPIYQTAHGKIETSYAVDGQVNDSYIVYTTDNVYLFEKSDVEVGDLILTKDFKQYEIESIDQENRIAYAKFIKDVKRPNITKKPKSRASQLSQENENKNICMYMTHNDESYKPTDGYDSIYGAGGIHDVAKKFKAELEKQGIKVTLDETLHIPHNSSAYSRSSVTAKKLNNQNPDALFDIHRDGVARSYYLTKIDNKEASKVRIVVGKSNPNFNQNYEFATVVFAVGQELYPWLFSDIYCGKGHYNQALQNKALLFEMGTYLIEKDLVYTSLPYLADVVNTSLYGTTVDEEEENPVDNIIIGGDITSKPTVNDHFNNISNTSSKGYLFWLIPLLITFVGGGTAIAAILIFSKPKQTKARKGNNKNKK